MGNVLALLIEPLEKRFTWREDEHEEGENEAKKDMLEAFALFPDAVLTKAAREIRHTRRATTMPTVGAIHEVLVRHMESAPQVARPANPSPKQLTPWQIAEEKARNWAVHACTTWVLGQMAFEEGWGLSYYAQALSFARGAYANGQEPNEQHFTLSEHDLAYYRQHACEPPYMRWLSYTALLGVPIDKAMADNAARCEAEAKAKNIPGYGRRPTKTQGPRSLGCAVGRVLQGAYGVAGRTARRDPYAETQQGD